MTLTDAFVTIDNINVCISMLVQWQYHNLV